VTSAVDPQTVTDLLHRYHVLRANLPRLSETQLDIYIELVAALRKVRALPRSSERLRVEWLCNKCAEPISGVGTTNLCNKCAPRRRRAA
jgi:hypothetical protein